ncbi:MAG: transporter substrate-binding domain-containing protein [Rhodobacteraceae bacterium]|uniref:transporter substrate-binding domain-containing protein n=1 Tax=Celeribacter sp. HF31 TaxID=2721558 RepID=UPI0014313AE9|nr:transporter substrate-binding domain-containing protein [Celeribacter sp. HF31]NIY80192.1 transporter substrate-binding domain-containing protein [Celeribacter sp. HF31]NVK46061.1 transporter substrate-binding domain-containing protein [Paracoccaceae bacterium]
MKNILLSAAALALLAGAASAETVRLGTEGAYPPYNYIDDNGEVAGFERVLGDELCARAELTCEWVTNDWDSIIPNLLSGNYDAIIAGMSITDERKEKVDFSQNYTPPSASAYAAMSEGVDLEGGIVAAQASTIQSAHVVETGATLLEFPSFEDAVAAVLSGEADAVLADKDTLVPVVSEGEVMFVGDDVPLGGGIGMAFRKSDPELRAKFDAAIQSMKDDGTLNPLISEWLEDSPTFE